MLASRRECCEIRILWRIAQCSVAQYSVVQCRATRARRASRATHAATVAHEHSCVGSPDCPPVHCLAIPLLASLNHCPASVSAKRGSSSSALTSMLRS